MLNCRRCGGETTVISNQSSTPRSGNMARTARRRECQECKSQADSTETWDEDGRAVRGQVRASGRVDREIGIPAEDASCHGQDGGGLDPEGSGKASDARPADEPAPRPGRDLPRARP